MRLILEREHFKKYGKFHEFSFNDQNTSESKKSVAGKGISIEKKVKN